MYMRLAITKHLIILIRLLRNGSVEFIVRLLRPK